MPLNDIVNVVITRQTQTVSEAGFGVPMILGASKNFTDLIRFYSSMDEVAVDFSPSEDEYVAAQDIFAQDISPTQIAIGRRQVDNATIAVETPMTGRSYTVILNNIPVTVTATTAFTYSVVTLLGDLVTDNRINLSVNGTGIGTITSVIDFDIDFVASNSIVATVNGTPIAAVPFNTDQATTMTDLATAIDAVGSVASATVTDVRQITVLFNAVGTNTVNSVITTAGATQPVATISQGGFVFNTDTQTTLQEIADQILVQFPTYTAYVSQAPERVLTVLGPTGTTATVNFFTVTQGASQTTVTITNPLQPVTRNSIVQQFVTVINANGLLPVTATNNNDGTFTLVNKVPGTAWTLRVSSNISNTNSALVRITQVRPNTEYTVTLNGVDYSYVTTDAIQTEQQIIQALVTLINLTPQAVVVIATNNGNDTFRIETPNPLNTFNVSVTPSIMTAETGLVILPYQATNNVDTDLTTINNANSNWYALILLDRGQPSVLLAANWIESRIKIFGTASSNSDIINVAPGTDTTSIAAVLNIGGYVRTFVMYHQDASYDFPEAAWFGRVLPLEPGSETWKFKTLRSVSYSNLTTTQSNNALGKKANTYEFVGGVGITQNGTMAQGEFIDIIRGIDWLTSRIQEYVYSVLVNNDKVPYTDAGIATIQSQVMRVMQLGVSNNFLASDPVPVVTVPKSADVPAIDKANRILRNVRFTATLAGAIHAVVIRGEVSV